VRPQPARLGISWDTRRDLPYGAYPEFKFNVPVGQGKMGVVGDCWDRYSIRVLEMLESAKIIRQAFDKLPEGEIMAKVLRKPKPEPGEAMARVESARGEMCYYVCRRLGEGLPGARAHRQLHGHGIIEEMSQGLMIADLIALIASFDVVAPEIDR